MKWLVGFCLCLPVPSLVLAASPQDCRSCHATATPAALRQWQESAHSRAGVGCGDCHDGDHEEMKAGIATVPAAVCGRCHEKAYRQHVASRHGMGLHSGWGCTRNLPSRDLGECRFCHEEGSTRPRSTVQCARFLKQSAAMRDIGCNRCHRVEESCAGCHTGHLTELKIVRDPGVCAKCHMGPDHPQWEMWQTSQHGTLFTSMGEAVGPTCQRCHMPGGSHDVSRGITATPGGVPFPVLQREERRREMTTVCVECHAPAFAARELIRADTVREESTLLTKEADAIVWDLADLGELDPLPTERAPHPFAGSSLVTDGQMLYEDTSHIERLLFKMKKYDWAKAVKGSYHQNPAYAHWYGNAELKMDLVDIRAEASRLKNRGGGSSPAGRTQSAEEDLGKALEVLKNKFERKAISMEEYAREKKRLLREY
ncbi:MAG: hypothetical protein A2091_11710 [Desulfuromonadales bacterium GWD2_61_12]|nr:MAG: hypothetical protein A2005_03820 [Desulfuromonadales bacterium GWC2_61_20]OGR34103.1 MAG: hypothetical protein A2091_11710 [Desulfuromonadales bacterium GWD2_61_12]HAD04792.1 hypothetical protein [Desulfuromonas sp.]HBT82312.1 hypothetical protein [Desulfuromonas sp.]